MSMSRIFSRSFGTRGIFGESPGVETPGYSDCQNKFPKRSWLWVSFTAEMLILFPTRDTVSLSAAQRGRGLGRGGAWGTGGEALDLSPEIRFGNHSIINCSFRTSKLPDLTRMQ